MKLTYPINLIGFEEDASSGDVVTRHGEYLGTWTFLKIQDAGTGVFRFVADGDGDGDADGEGEPKFSETVGDLDSGLSTGLAMSMLCGAIRCWHDAQDQSGQ